MRAGARRVSPREVSTRLAMAPRFGTGGASGRVGSVVVKAAGGASDRVWSDGRGPPRLASSPVVAARTAASSRDGSLVNGWTRRIERSILKTANQVLAGKRCDRRLRAPCRASTALATGGCRRRGRRGSRERARRPRPSVVRRAAPAPQRPRPDPAPPGTHETERGDLAPLSVLEDLDLVFAEVRDRLAAVVPCDHVEEHDLRIRAERRGLLRQGRGPEQADDRDPACGGGRRGRCLLHGVSR